MDIRIKPGKLSGRVSAPPSKSELHRYLIAAALSHGVTDIAFTGDVPDDVSATVRCLTELGASFSRIGGGFTVCGLEGIRRYAVLDCGESGATLRFLLPIIAATGAECMFSGSGRLPERPTGELINALQRGGCNVFPEKLPYRISGKLQPGEYVLNADISSQFCSGLLMALPLLHGDSRIELKRRPVSRGYIDMTRDILLLFGVNSTEYDREFIVPGEQNYKTPGRAFVSGDWSAAAFMLCAGALGGDVSVYNLIYDSFQADSRICSVLNAELERTAVRVRTRILSPFDIDCTDTPDLVPALSVLASGAEGISTIRGIGRLRMKESDRVNSVCELITSLGGEIIEHDNNLIINGRKKLSGGKVKCFNDHRIAMAAGLAASICTDDITLLDAECVKKSYPDFWRDYSLLGGNVSEI